MPKGWLALAAAGALVGGIAMFASAGVAADAAPAPSDVREDVWVVIEAKCLRCHNPRQKRGKLDMSSLAAMLAGGESGPALVVGNAGKSLMIDLIDFDEMPPRKEKPRVTKAELAQLRAWIDGGAAGRTAERGGN
jgi:hypothetical protein